MNAPISIPDHSPTPAAATPAQALIHVVDDDDAVRDSLLLLLGLEDYRVEGFASAAAFLATLETSRPAALVLDLQMPGNGGFEVLAALAARRFSLPVILISGQIDRAARRRALDAGVCAILDKPLDGQELLAALSTVAISR